MLDALLNVGGKLIDKLIPDPQAKAQAQLELARLAQEGELAKIANESKLFEAEQTNLTSRHQADMGSDSWLSKNIRPLTLVFILAAYSLFSIGSAVNFDVNEKYVELLGQWGMLIMSFYFGGRTLEKILSLKNQRESKDGVQTVSEKS